MSILNRSYQTLWRFFILVLLGSILYAQTLDDPFHFDDTITIIENRAVHLLPDWPSTIKELAAFQPSRLAANLTFAMNYYVGRFDSRGYHAVNIIVHLTTAALVWWLGNLLVMLISATAIGEKIKPTGKAVPSKKKVSAKSSHNNIGPHAHIPFLAALVFLAHPVNTQAVSYISQRSEAMAALFYVASVCCYIQGRVFVTNKLRWFILSATSGLLASFSKETAITLPLMIIAVELFFFKRNNDVLSRKFLFAILGIGFISLVPAAFKFNYAQMLSRPYLSQSHLGDVLTLPTYLMTQVCVFVTFLRLAFVPVGLNLDYDYPMVQSAVDPVFLGCLILLAGMGAAAIILRRKHPLVTFAAVWFFLALSSNLVPRAHVMFEHKLYLALTGMLPSLFIGLSLFVKDRRVMTGGLCCLIVVFGILTFQRNRVWGSEVALWEDVLKKSPNKARVHLSLGAAYASDGQYRNALKYFTNAIGMLGDPYRAYSNRGAVYVKMGKDDLALADFNRAIALERGFSDVYLNRGELLARHKDYLGALADIEKVIGMDPNNPSGYRMRGRMFDAMRQYDRAWADYNKAIALDPSDAQARAWRGFLYAATGRMDQAFADFDAALRLDPEFSDAYIYRGMYYKDRRQKEEAFRDFDRAVVLTPDSSLAFYQRASARFDFGELDASFADVNKAIALDESFDLPYSLRGIIRARRNELGPAMEDFNKAVALQPNSAVHYINRAKLYKILGDTSGMNKDIQAAKSLGFSVDDKHAQ